jgi:hypothetical protein
MMLAMVVHPRSGFLEFSNRFKRGENLFDISDCQWRQFFFFIGGPVRIALRRRSFEEGTNNHRPAMAPYAGAHHRPAQFSQRTPRRQPPTIPQPNHRLDGDSGQRTAEIVSEHRPVITE